MIGDEQIAQGLGSRLPLHPGFLTRGGKSSLRSLGVAGKLGEVLDLRRERLRARCPFRLVGKDAAIILQECTAAAGGNENGANLALVRRSFKGANNPARATLADRGFAQMISERSAAFRAPQRFD